MRHSGKAYVGWDVHTNGIGSFWVMSSRATSARITVSTKHLDRYAQDFAERHNQRTLDQRAGMLSGHMATLHRSGGGMRSTTRSSADAEDASR